MTLRGDAVPEPRDVRPFVADAVLGRGGAAEVYRVRAPDGTGPFALKVLLRADPELVQRLRREARVLGALRHPCLVRVFEVVEVCGCPALRMECVEGPSLREALVDGPPPLGVADRLARGLLSAMAVAHAGGVVHRDLKPGNILLDSSEGELRPRVVDFGLARELSPEDSLETATGMFLGTTRYMAPEQLRGRVDTRSDVWALGAVLFELMTGRPAFEEEDPVRLLARITDGDRGELPAGVPAAWQAAIDHALRVDPSQRPVDAAALLALWAEHGAPASSDDEDWVRRARSRYQPQILAPSPPPHHLPPRDSTFIGRATELTTLPAAVRAHRVVTLLGPGGVGKTRLSLEIGDALVSEFPGGVWFCDLRDARSAAGIAQCVARVLGVPLGFDALGAVADALAARPPLLLILDNFEQVVEHAAPTVGAWRDTAPNTRFLVTSRLPLNLPDERAIRLDVLDLPQAAHPEASASFALFVARARRASPDFRVDDSNRPVIVRLVRALDGLPLAIEIAAARVRGRSLDKLEARLGKRLHALPVPTSFASGHQRTLRATLDWSWALLSVDQRAALAQLSVFEGGASTEAAQAVVSLHESDVAAVTRALAQASLVKVLSDGRLDLLVSVQVYAARRARELGLFEPACVRHGAFFAQLGSLKSASRLDGPDAAQHGRMMHRELDNLVCGCERAIEDHRLETAALCQLASWAVLMDRGPFSVGHALSLRVRDLALDGVSAETQARVRWVGGITSHYAGDMQEARRSYEEGVRVCHEQGVEYLLPTILNSMTLEAVAVGDLPRARGYLEEALSRGSKHRPSGTLLGNLASIELQLGHLDAAEAHLEQALRGSVEEGAGHSLGVQLLVQANLGRIRGDFDLAEQAIARSHETFVSVGNDVQLTAVAVGEGWLALRRGRLEGLEARLIQAGAQATALGKLLTASSASLALAELCQSQGRFTQALQHARAAAELADRGDEVAAHAYAQAVQARALLELGQAAVAEGLLHRALAELESSHAVWFAGASLVLAELCASQGEVEAAEEALERVGSELERWGLGPEAWLLRRHAEVRDRVAALSAG